MVYITRRNESNPLFIGNLHDGIAVEVASAVGSRIGVIGPQEHRFVGVKDMGSGRVGEGEDRYSGDPQS